MIRSDSKSQREIMGWISELYVGPGFHLDPTYGLGLIHKGLVDPELKSDKEPRISGTLEADFRILPYLNGTVRSIMFDPPFLAGGGGSGKIEKHFTSYGSVDHMIAVYWDAFKEFYRVLAKKGYLVVKCQDICNGRVQTFTHVEIYNMAQELGLYCQDLFVLRSNRRPIQKNLKKQLHARKYHSYFLVFQKIKRQNKRWKQCQNSQY